MLHVYTGDGKGKTTAAAGLAARAAGHGKTVLFAQFLKDGTSGEVVSLRRAGVTVAAMPPVRGFVFKMTDAEREQCARDTAAAAETLIREIRRTRPFLTVLDELTAAVSCGVLPEETARALVDAALAAGECAVTGRDAPGWLTERADYVSRVESVRHPYDRGVPAREGVEW